MIAVFSGTFANWNLMLWQIKQRFCLSVFVYGLKKEMLRTQSRSKLSETCVLQYSSKCKGQEKQGKTEKLSQTRGNWGDMTRYNVVY